MYLVERFWTVVAAIANIFTFSPVSDGAWEQTPLRPSNYETSLTSGSVVVDALPVPQPPSFAPPGGIPEKTSHFRCEYPAMTGWKPCSTATDRTCWLEKIDGSEPRFDIYTDYETRAPIGITREYTLELWDSHWDADGINFPEAKLFNKTYPGPWIQACWGDRVVVKVINRLLHNGTSVHWHGIRQNQTMEMDGVNGVTQCPIAPNDYFVYNFTTTQYGSSWYHSHYSVQYADGAAGGLTIHGPTIENWDEAISPPLIMTDWAHESAFTSVMSKNDPYMPDILLNGRGDIRKWNEKNRNETVIKPPFNITFEEARTGHKIKKYLLRIINTSFDTTFLFSIDHHNLTIVSADFVPIQPFHTNSILVGIGQRYELIVEAWPLEYHKGDQLPEDGNYWIRTFVASDCFAKFEPPVGNTGYEKTGILRYNDASKEDPNTEPWPSIQVPVTCQDPTVYRFDELHPVLPWNVGSASNGLDGQNFTTVLFATLEDPPPKSYPLAKWALGSEPWTSIRVNYSDPMLFNLDQKEWDHQWRVEPMNYNSLDGKTRWVYIVLETRFVAHPIHLHGHDFAILDAQPYKFNPKNATFRKWNPMRRDVVLLPFDFNTNAGYVVIAFKADNPGPWLVHCHIAFHISEGLGFQILEDQDHAAQIWRKDGERLAETRRVCRNWGLWYNNGTNHWPEKNCSYPDPADCFMNDSGV